MTRKPVSPEQIVVADLSNWHYRPLRGQVAVDPQLGRIVFPPRELPKKGIWVSYHYGFSADIGGGEYARMLSQPDNYSLYRVGEGKTYENINSALKQWKDNNPENAVIEIAASGVYVEPVNIELSGNQSLQIRAASGVRPVIRLLDWLTDRPDSLFVKGNSGSRFTIDGVMVAGRGVQVQGDLASFCIRHSTLVPGWSLHPDCEPQRPAEPSLELVNTDACVIIEHSIIGSIQVNQDEVRTDPVQIHISDSILDATSKEREAVGAPGCPVAHAVLKIIRCTIFGQVQTHAIELAENSIFMGLIKVARRQVGCMRFCYVTPGSRTPRRYNCQPDLVKKQVDIRFEEERNTKEEKDRMTEEERDRLIETEPLRVKPGFNSSRYGTPTYCQLADHCAEEIKRGADDQSEMGVFHDLYQPQKTANLEARLEEYTPAGMDAGIIFTS